jgi:SHS2 domain-containing protein
MRKLFNTLRLPLNMKKYKFLEHTADIKFQAEGKNLEELFSNSAYALKKIICRKRIKAKIKKNFGGQIEGVDLAGVLQSFLEEFLFDFDSEGFILSKIKKIKIKEKSGAYFIECEAVGDKAENYEIENHVKAITYNELSVKKQGKKWISQVIVDV